VSTVFERVSGPLLVKIDIEGTEYEILEHVLDHADRILGLVIEWHEIRSGTRRFLGAPEDADYASLVPAAYARFANHAAAGVSYHF